MATPDPDIVHGLARCIAIHRDLFRDTVAEAAERHNLTPAQVIEALAWYRRAERAYRGTPTAAAAEALATATRRRRAYKLQAERTRTPVGGAEILRDHLQTTFETADPDRPQRPCANCGSTFQPTLRRRMLCVLCYRDGEETARGTTMLHPA